MTPQEHYNRGMEYIKKKDYVRARLEFANAIRQHPTFPEAHYQLAVASLELADKDYGTAFRALLIAERLDEQKKSEFSIDIRLRLGLLLLYERDFQAVRERAQWVLKQDPSNNQARELLAFALSGLAQPKLAAQELDLLLEAMPQNLQARMMRASIFMADNEVEAAKQQLEEAVQRTNRSPESLVALGNLYQLAGQPEKAEPVYREAIQSYPDKVGPRNGLGWMYARLGQRQKAEDVFREIGRIRSQDPEAAAALANYYFFLKDWPLAIAELERVSAANPKDRLNRNRLAGAYLLAGRRADAEKLVARLTTENPADVQANLVSGVLHLQAGHNKEAIGAFNHVLHFRSDYAPAHFYLGVALYRDRNEQTAQQSLINALRRDPYLLVARVWLAELQLQHGSPEAALGTLRDAPPQQQQLPLVRLLRALCYVGMKRYNLAIDEIRSVLAEDPQMVPGYYQMGFTHLLDRQGELARQAMEAGLKAEPASVEMLTVLAHSWVSEGKPELAAARVEKQVQQFPQSGPHYQLLGDVQRMAGRSAAARAAFERAASLTPDVPGPIMGLMQTEFAEGNLERARERCATLVERWPNSALAWTWMGAILEAQKAYPEAVKAYEKALKIDHSSAIAANNLARRLLYDGGDLTRALILAERARSLQPENGAFADTLGWIYYKMGSRHFAEGPLREAVRRQPRNPIFLYHLSVIESEQGNEKQALAKVQAALELNPNFSEAAEARRLLEKLQKRIPRKPS